MKFAIIEDELPALRRLERMILELRPNWKLVFTSDGIEDSIEKLNSMNHPDLIFMDIQLSDGLSFEIFEKLKINSNIIFTTAFDEYAIKAFKVNSIDYLLKPISSKDLIFAIEKAEKNTKIEVINDVYSLINEIKNKEYKTRFLVKQGTRLISLPINEIAVFYSEDKVNFVIDRNKKRYILDLSLDLIEASINPKDFFRINRGVIASISSIEEVHTHLNGKLKIHLNVDLKEEVFVSREKASAFKQWLDT